MFQFINQLFFSFVNLFIFLIVANPEFVVKQHEILRLLNKVHEPNRNTEQYEIGKSFDLSTELTGYKDSHAPKALLKAYKAGTLLPRGAIFTLFNEKHRSEMILLFESFFYANDWDLFYKTACWARDRINEGQFVYALSVAVLHRSDTRGIVLPPPYEIYPHLFVNSEVIHAAYKAKMRQEPAVVWMNFTGNYD